MNALGSISGDRVVKQVAVGHGSARLPALLLAAALVSAPAAAGSREARDPTGLADDAGNEETQGWTLPAMRGVPLRAPADPPPPRRPPEGADAWEQDGRGGEANEETRGWTWPGPAGTRP